MSLLNKLAGVSPTTKAAGVTAAGAVLAAVAWRLNAGVGVEVVGVGLVGLGVVLLIYVQILGLFEKQRAAKFGKNLQGDVSEKFRAGWQRLSKAGKDKDPYFLPWYLMVGEPGAGKTQAIKHSNIKFVPGFNDPGAGEGGTLLMDWWFADKAIFLDTAGALLMDTARTAEFQEFLHRIRQYRPNPPVNGLILAIPANALQTDTDEEIAKKAQVIAQQLELVQRELGVRFPVYVIITKADLISGFREFFNSITDPSAAYQVLGWSNPSQLDGTFDPAEVELHLEAVAAALRRRRMALILEPNIGADTASRIDRTDALFAFPEQLSRTGSRLRTYLENVFMPSEWTDSPLFLRGIYFTSSMREGPPLDLDLAQAFNISPKDLPAEVRVWEREKACFLRDLFIEKIFREKGLVTAAKNVDQRVRRQHMMFLGAAAAAAVVVLAFSFFGYKELQQSVGKHAEFWAAVGRVDPVHPELPSTFEWVGKPPGTNLADIGIQYGNGTKLADLYAENLKLAQEDIHTPAIFALADLFNKEVAGGNINDRRKIAHRLLFEQGVLRPTWEKSWSWLLRYEPLGSTMAWAWDSQSTQDNDNLGRKVLIDLIGLDHDGPYPLPRDDTDKHLLAATAADEGWGRTISSSLQVFAQPPYFEKHAPLSMPMSSPNATAKRLEAVLKRITDHNTAQLNHLKRLAANIQAFDEQEQYLIGVLNKTGQYTNSSDYAADLAKALKTVDTAAANLDAMVSGRVLLVEIKKTFQDNLASDIQLVSNLQQITGSDAIQQPLQPAAAALNDLQKDTFLVQYQDPQLNAWNHEILGDADTRAYAPRLAAYHAVLAAWQGAKLPAGSLDIDHLDVAAKAIGSAGSFSGASNLGDTSRGQTAQDAIGAAMKAGARRQVYLTLASLYGQPPRTPTDFKPASAIPLVQHWQQARAMLDSAGLAADDLKTLQVQRDSSQSTVLAYLNKYADHWSEPAARDLTPPDKTPDSAKPLSDALNKKGTEVVEALAVVRGSNVPTWVALDSSTDSHVSAALDDVQSGLHNLPEYTRRADDFLSEWKSLEQGDILASRQKLAKAGDDQLLKYHAFAPTGHDDFVVRCWATVAAKVEKDFQSRCQAAVKDGMTKLIAQLGFPVIWTKTDQPMSSDSLQQSLALIDTLRAAPTKDPWVKTIAYVPTGDEEKTLDQRAKRIQYWARDPQVIVSLAVGDDEKIPDDVNQEIKSPQYAAGLTSLAQYARFGEGDPKKLSEVAPAKVAAPADDGVVLHFVDSNNNSIDEVNVPGGKGQWAVLRLLSPATAKPTSDPALWYVRWETQKRPGRAIPEPVWLKIKLNDPPADFTAALK